MGDRTRSGLARGPALVILVVSGLVLAVLAAVLVPWSWVPGGMLVPRPASSLFSPAEIHRSEQFSALHRWLGWPAYFSALGLVAVLGLSRRGSRLLRRVVPSRRWWVSVPLGVLVLVVLQALVQLPFEIGAHRVDQVFGTSRQGFGPWSVDRLKAVLVSWVGTSVALLVLVGCARRSARWWFAWAGGAAVALTLAGSFLYPVVVEPLFNSFTPMPPGPFRTAVLRLADEDGVHVDDVLVADASRRTTTLNAYVSGYGRTRRVVVYDTLLRELTPAQALVVVAHELGHARNDDVVLGTGLAAVGSVGGVALLALLLDSDRLQRRSGTRGAADPAAVALVLALVALGGFVVSPVQNTVSRAVEARADRVAIQTTHADRTFVVMQRRLALAALADPSPPALSQLWWGTHPTVLQRAGLPASLRRAAR